MKKLLFIITVIILTIVVSACGNESKRDIKQFESQYKEIHQKQHSVEKVMDKIPLKELDNLSKTDTTDKNKKEFRALQQDINNYLIPEFKKYKNSTQHLTADTNEVKHLKEDYLKTVENKEKSIYDLKEFVDLCNRSIKDNEDILDYTKLFEKNRTEVESDINKAQNKEVKVGVLQLLSHPALDQIYKGLEDGLAKEGYKVGDNLKIDLQNAQGDQSNLASMGQKLVSDNNDILVGITTPATLSLSNATKDKPIIMAGITYPVEAGLIKSEDKPGNNITGVSDRTPIKQQLEIMKKVLPKMKKVGILYTASEDNSVKQAQEAEKLAKELGLEVKVSSIANTNDIQQVTESLASETDAIFVPIDNTIASAMSTVVKVTDAKKIPVFPSADTMVADGGVLGIGVDQYQIGVETAKVVAKVLKGEDTKNMPIVLANEGVIYLNEAKAKQLGIEIPNEVKEKAKVVDKK